MHRAIGRDGERLVATLPSGGRGRDEPITTGARSVDDPRDLLEHLDETPIGTLLGR